MAENSQTSDSTGETGVINVNINEKILASREDRARKIEFLKKRFKSVITVKSNIPGCKKKHAISYLLIEEFIKLIDIDFCDETFFYDSLDGPYYLIGSHLDGEHLKTHLVQLEDMHFLGRLIDLDVYADLKPLTRGHSRQCLLCERKAIECMRQGRHTEEDVLSVMVEMVKTYFTNIVSGHLYEAVFAELNLDPKFGLVTPLTNGSHPDMNYTLMEKAYRSIHPFLLEMFLVGWDGIDLTSIFNHIRAIGLEAERKMLKTTSGVNAYKGLIFNLGLTVAALGFAYGHHRPLTSIFDIITNMCETIMDDFLNDDESFGSKAYRNYSITGARGEANRGMPHVQEALRRLSEIKHQPYLRTLMYLISTTEDTVLLKRTGSFEAYRNVKQRFQRMLNASFNDILKLDRDCRQKKLSFGGSADLLIVTIFLHLTGLKI